MPVIKKTGIAASLTILAIAAAAAGGQTQLADLYRRGTVRFVPAIVVDEAALPKDDYFQGIADIKCDPKGNVYVCDMNAHNIKIFDASGKLKKIIGREGQGPGEFSWPSAIAVSADRLIVLDLRNHRLCLMTLEGVFLKSAPVSYSEGMPLQLESLPDGTFAIGSMATDYNQRDKPQIYAIRIVSADLQPLRTLLTLEVMENKYADVGGRFSNIPQPFTPRMYWTVAPGGRIIVGNSRDYVIDVYDPVRGKISSFRRAYEPVKVTEEDKTKYFAGMVSTASDGGMKKGAPDWLVKATDFPKIKPPFHGLFADAEGNILVNAYRLDRSEEWKVVDVFAPDGTFIATVKSADDVQWPFRSAALPDGFWAPRFDEDGIVSLVKYRISR